MAIRFFCDYCNKEEPAKDLRWAELTVSNGKAPDGSSCGAFRAYGGYLCRGCIAMLQKKAPTFKGTAMIGGWVTAEKKEIPRGTQVGKK